MQINMRPAPWSNITQHALGVVLLVPSFRYFCNRHLLASIVVSHSILMSNSNQVMVHDVKGLLSILIFLCCDFFLMSVYII